MTTITLDFTFNEWMTIVAVFTFSIIVLCLVLIMIGYGLGRNSSEKPVISRENQSPNKKEDLAPIDEPDYDLFNEAAYGDDEHTQGISTMTGK